MRKIIFVLMMFMCLLVISETTYAKAQNGLNLEYELNATDEIKLNWNNIASKYIIYKDNKQIGESNSNFYTINNLEEDYNYSFTVVAYKGKKLYDISTVKLQTMSNESLFKSFSTEDDNSESDLLKNTNLNVVINSTEVKIELQGYIPDDDGILELYRDGTYIGSLDDRSFIDTDIESDITYDYKVVGKVGISQNEKDEINKYIIENELTFSDEELEEIYQKPFELTRIVTIPSGIEDQFKQLTIQPLSTTTPAFVLRYKTFIPDCKVDALSLVQGLAGYKFGGDCRGFSFSDTTNYRTWVESLVRFTSTSSSLDTTGRFVGWTNLYNSKGALVESRRASNSGIVYSNISKTSSKLTYTLTHGVTIPFGVAPEINYKYTASVYKSGSYSISGTRDQAPSHEFYIFSPSKTISQRTIFTGTNKGFQYLLPIYSNQL